MVFRNTKYVKPVIEYATYPKVGWSLIEFYTKPIISASAHKLNPKMQVHPPREGPILHKGYIPFL